MANTHPHPIGPLLREWRQRRRLSQLDLALEADISTRHLSFLETGRAQPSRDMLLHLADRLDVPLRDRNMLLVAAGFAPVFRERKLDDPALKAAREAIDLVLAGHAPYPALAIDRHWNLVAANEAVKHVLAGTDASLLTPPINVLRLALHPQGLAPRTVNFAEWRTHLLDRLRKQIDVSADPTLIALMAELRALPTNVEAGYGKPLPAPHDYGGVVVPFKLQAPSGVLSFFSTTTIFGTPVDITLSELAIEAFYPADAATVEAMRKLAGG